MNERDSERLAAALRARGHAPADEDAGADAVIVNTCCVREKAEAKALGKLRMLLAERRRKPDRIIGAMGCLVQRLGQEILRQARGLDFAVGTRCQHRLPEILEAVLAGRKPVLDISAGGGDPAAGPPGCGPEGHAPGRPTALVSILFGCNRRCAYCIVPRVRGAEWSRPAAEIVEEVRGLATAGAREVTLLGQSIMAYGRANTVWPAGGRSPRGFSEPLPRLLEALQDIPGLARVRFTSSHPAGCTPELVRAVAELPAVCEHLHLPLQSGSDRILERMGRGYTAAEYREAARRLRAAVPGLALTTDLIVGFPSETPDDFDQTRALAAEIGFDNAFIFQYNARPDTVAGDWPDDVPPEEKRRRNHALLEEQNRRCLEINRALVGSQQEVLAEGPSRRNPVRWMGRTRTNKIVLFDAAAHVRRGDLLTVRIDVAKIQTLYGTLAAGRPPRAAEPFSLDSAGENHE